MKLTTVFRRRCKSGTVIQAAAWGDGTCLLFGTGAASLSSNMWRPG